MKEFPHLAAAESHACAESFTLAEFEVSDSFFRVSDRRLLAGDLRNFCDGIVNGYLAVWGFAHAGGDDDFFKSRDLMRIGVTELFGQVRHNLVFVVLQ